MDPDRYYSGMLGRLLSGAFIGVACLILWCIVKGVQWIWSWLIEMV